MIQLLLFFIVFILALWKSISWIWYYWDWIFPIFTDDIFWYFTINSFSRSEMMLWSPLSYSSDYFFRLIVWFLGSIINIQPEIYLSILIIWSFSILSVFVYSAYKSKAIYLPQKVILFWSVLLIFLNQTIFYKLLAGHLNYIFSYIIYIVLVIFLLRKHNYTFKHTLIVSILFSFVWSQIQFFIFAYITILVFYLIKDNSTLLKKFLKLLFIWFNWFFINNFWLINFIIWVNQMNKVTNLAQTNTFQELLFIDFYRIFSFTGNSPTMIEYFYNNIFLIFSILIFVLSIYFLLKKRNKNNLVLLILLILFIWFTQIFWINGSQNIWFLFMFREIWHILPVIFILCIFIFLENFSYYNQIFTRYIFASIIAIFLITNIYIYSSFLPYINFSNLRDSSFEIRNDILKFSGEDKTSRILFYPFYWQYSYKNTSTNLKDNKGIPLNNSWYDSLIRFSKFDSIFDGIIQEEFKNSIQTRLIHTRDVNFLRKYNIGYILDFWDIYESNLEKYLLLSTYKDKKNIKNIKNFVYDLKKSNNNIEQLSKYVYKINNVFPRITWSKLNFYQSTTTEYSILTKQIKQKEKLLFLSNFHSEWKLYLEPYSPINCSWSTIYTWTLSPEVVWTWTYITRLWDTVDKITKNITWAINYDIISLNPDLWTWTLKKGQEIIIPKIDTHSWETYDVKECPRENKFYVWWELSKLWHKPIFEDTHKLVYDYANQWTIDPEYIKENYPKEYYKENPDWSIDLRLTLYFKPQSYFYLGLIISWITFLLLVLYLIIDIVIRFRRKNK